MLIDLAFADLNDPEIVNALVWLAGLALCFASGIATKCAGGAILCASILSAARAGGDDWFISLTYALLAALVLGIGLPVKAKLRKSSGSK